MPKITTMLWFDQNAEEAARFYTSIFPNSRIDQVVRAATETPSNEQGDVLTSMAGTTSSLRRLASATQ